MAKNITYEHFIAKYVQNLPEDFKWQSTPLQIYPLEFISKFLSIPIPLLQADYHFIVFLSKGIFSQQTGMEYASVKAPAILYVPEGEAFSLKSIQSDLAGFFILLENKAISSIINKIELSDLLSIGRITNLSAGHSPWFDSLCTLLHKEITEEYPNRKVGEGLLQAFFHKLITLNNGKKTTSRQSELANNFKQLLNKKFKEHKSVEFYARELNVSQNYLNRCVKTYYNKSCKNVIQEFSIIQSQILMLDTLKDISEIAFEIGFEDTSYFSRVFKKVTGQTPSAFKTQIMHSLS